MQNANWGTETRSALAVLFNAHIQPIKVGRASLHAPLQMIWPRPELNRAQFELAPIGSINFDRKRFFAYLQFCLSGRICCAHSQSNLALLLRSAFNRVGGPF